MKTMVKSIAKRMLGRGSESFSVNTPFSEKVVNPLYNNEVLYHDNLQVPPMSMRDKVRKSAILAEDFLLEGIQTFEELKCMLDDHNIRLAEDIDMLEFGVGCGRIARHFVKTDIQTFHGTDVDNELTKWCSDVISV